MSTRAVYTFIEQEPGTPDIEAYHVYKHFDGYPAGAAVFIKNAIDYAWPLPRYEACEFAAAFIAANKQTRKTLERAYPGGDVYLTTHFNDHGDLDYRYEILMHNKKLRVEAFKWNYESESWDSIFIGSLDDFVKKYK
ncbi:hypothetical protein AQUSIP_13120 [Aquicella siphonis]|uniref:Uncharacterized protein n=1 Tax=Aquicella siphonis TaxID=254247 RepID=A0A5E4PI45_9COXI|nr:hypothetical protein [Aquicella siphonis]VVC76011.1 hypothetical protein AQUSIP_13120 [Aquicella siphonis]